MANPNKQEEKGIGIEIWGKKLVGINFLIAMCAGVFIIWVVYQIIVMLVDRPNDVGGYGDLFGGLNALFAGLAFAALIYAILLQTKELSLQREELNHTREELAQQTRVISAQLEAMQSSMNFQIEKESRDSEPVISCMRGRATGGHKNLRIINVGARITDMEIEIVNSKFDRDISLTSRDVLDNRGECEINIKGEKVKEEMLIKLSYKDKMGKRGSKTYLIPNDLFELRLQDAEQG